MSDTGGKQELTMSEMFERLEAEIEQMDEETLIKAIRRSRGRRKKKVKLRSRSMKARGAL